MPDADRGRLRAAAPAMPFVLVTVLLDTLGVGLIIPASAIYGWLVSLYSLMQFVFAPVLGGLSDRFGRRAVILPSLFGAACSYLVSGLAPALWWLFLGRLVAGITGASFSAANAYVADITPPEKRAARFGAVGAVFGLGFILGPWLGGELGGYGLFVLPESLAKENRRPFSLARANPFGSLRSLGKHPVVLRLTGTLFCAFMAQMILQSTWALANQARYGWTPRGVGRSLMAVGLGMAIVQGLLVRRIVPRLGERRALLVGLALGAAGYAAIGAAQHGWEIYVLILLLALGGIAGPAVQAIITSEVGPKEQGELQGALNSLSGMAAIIGPIIGTGLLAQFGPETATPHIPGASFYAASAFSLVGLVLAARVFATLPTKVALVVRPD